MKEITGMSGACADQTRIRIRFDLKGKEKREVKSLMNKGFSLSVDQDGFLFGEARGTFEEILGLLKLLKTKGFKDKWI